MEGGRHRGLADAGQPGHPRLLRDRRACTMVDHAPPAWAGARWFYDATETGKVLLAARAEMERQEAPHPMWFYLTPGDR